jgi:hypothetical protein
MVDDWDRLWVTHARDIGVQHTYQRLMPRLFSTDFRPPEGEGFQSLDGD